MNWIIENWFVVVGIMALIGIALLYILGFFNLPTKQQLAKIKEWLLWAVIQAESELGSGTGAVKLRYVYDLFVQRFPTISKLVSFETFSSLVDEALDKMRELLETNKAVKELVEKKEGSEQ